MTVDGRRMFRQHDSKVLCDGKPPAEKIGMDNLKWYDFLGALILLFSVTKSAIKPPEVTNYTNSYLAPSASTTFNMDFQKIAPREAALSQIDMLNPTMSGNSITPEVQVEMVNVVPGDVSVGWNNPTAKSIPKSAPRVETKPDRKGEILVGLGSRASSLVPVFIC